MLLARSFRGNRKPSLARPKSRDRNAAKFPQYSADDRRAKTRANDASRVWSDGPEQRSKPRQRFKHPLQLIAKTNDRRKACLLAMKADDPVLPIHILRGLV